jgi:hypothetical protein
VRQDLHGAADQALSAFAQALKGCHREVEGASEVLQRLLEQDVSDAALRTPQPTRMAACRHLPATVGAAIMVDSALAAAIAGLEDELNWRQAPDCPHDHACAEIIGPHGCFAGDDFRLGLLLLGPGLKCPDQVRPAPQLTWLLTGPSEWKRGAEDFVARQAGEMIWHGSHVVHATRTADQPLLALWARIRKVGE